MRQPADLIVADVRRETPDCVSISFDVSNHPEYLNFRAGQYVNLDLVIQGSEVRRSYSICSTPGSGELRVAVKAVESGFASVHLQTAKVGDRIKVWPPEGNFLTASGSKHHVFFGAGSGITPLKSMIGEVLQDDSRGNATLFFGNRSAAHTIFKQSLEDLAEGNARFQLQHVWTDGSLEPRYSGRMDFSKALELLHDVPNDGLDRAFYLCGPAGMIGSVKEALLDQGVSSTDIHIEYFAAPVEENASDAPVADAPQSAPIDGASQVTVVLDDERLTVPLEEDGEVILDAALDAGLDAPFSCKGGVCTTCRAKVLSGTVKMDANYALTDGEVEEGYILTCQAHPTSAEVTVSWDEP